jgi:hypothetical protein
MLGTEVRPHKWFCGEVFAAAFLGQKKFLVGHFHFIFPGLIEALFHEPAAIFLVEIYKCRLHTCQHKKLVFVEKAVDLMYHNLSKTLQSQPVLWAKHTAPIHMNHKRFFSLLMQSNHSL